jgi:hypothetical protein
MVEIKPDPDYPDLSGAHMGDYTEYIMKARYASQKILLIPIPELLTYQAVCQEIADALKNAETIINHVLFKPPDGITVAMESMGYHRAAHHFHTETLPLAVENGKQLPLAILV